MTDDEKLKAMVDAYVEWCNAKTWLHRDNTWVAYCIARDAYLGVTWQPAPGTFADRF